MSLPMRERELKRANPQAALREFLSLPTRERELNLFVLSRTCAFLKSLPTRERELKPALIDAVNRRQRRSPRGSAN